MSDTPETDREEIVMGRTECDRYVLAEFSRRLERERDEAKQQYDDLATEHVLAVNKLAEERDAAREQSAKFRDIAERAVKIGLSK